MRDTRQKHGDRISLGGGCASRSALARGLRPHFRAIVAALLLALGGSASADPAGQVTPSARAVPWPVQANLDGIYVHLGPQVAAVHRQGGWDSAVGAELSVVRLREDEPLALVGARVIGARWSEENGGRVGVEGVAATRPLGVLVGVAAGPLLDLADLHHPRIGGSAAIWCYAGVVPYVRVGVIEASGGFIEAGLELPLPVWRRRP